jgi:hypothetical protein
MRLFFSGGPKSGIELDLRIPAGQRYRLMSCHGDYLRNAHMTSRDIVARGEPCEIMYDSGAFTAWSKGSEVELDHLIRVYDDMIEKYEPHVQAVWLISLDKIPGSRGQTATPADIEEAVRISDINFNILQKRYGDRVLPVFHQNESDARLHEVAAMAPYICISPRNDLHEESRRRWSAEVHAKIPGKNTHGLAATGYQMMTKVPWGSVDSATWVLLAANGSIFYDEKLRALQISDQSSSIKDKDQHFRTLPKIMQEKLVSDFEAAGFTLQGLEKDFSERMMYNRVVMENVARAIPPQEVVAETIPTAIPLFGL